MTMNLLMIFNINNAILEVAEALGGHGAAQLADQQLRGLGHARVEGDRVDAAQYERVRLHVVAAGRAERRLAHQQLVDQHAQRPAVYRAVVTLHCHKLRIHTQKLFDKLSLTIASFYKQ